MSIAVVIASYNQADLLPTAVEQYGNQSLPPDEIIVVDDGSTDGTPAVLDELCRAWPQLRVVRHARNLGVNAAVSSGMRAARADYVRPASTHDPVEPRFLERMLRLMKANPSAGIGFCDPAAIDPGGRKQLFRLHLAKEEAFLPPAEMRAALRRASFTIPSGTTIFRRQALLEVGAFNPAFARHADWFANLACALRHGACYIPGHLAFYLEHPGAMGLPQGHWTGEERRIAAAILGELREPRNADLWQAFRAAGVLPTMGLRPLWWAATDLSTSGFVSATLIRHCVVESVWRRLRPFTPRALRHAARWIGGVCGGLGFSGSRPAVLRQKESGKR